MNLLVIPRSFCLTGEPLGPGAIDLAHNHDPWLVLLAFLIAAFASYVSLNLGDRIGRTEGRVRLGWLGGAALSMGGGIWSMHFIAMLAFSLDAPVDYDPWITALSLVVAIAVTATAFHLVGRAKAAFSRLLLGGTIMGLGVAAMHYVGMLAMQMVPVIEYDTILFSASVLIAMAAATVALYLAFNLRFAWQRAAAAVVMAAAICGMHYTGMAAASFRWPNEEQLIFGNEQHGLLAISVALGMQMILMLALLSVFADRKLKAANAAADAKSTFLATMSHEIRTPMNGVIGMIELLERSGLRSDQMKMLSTIRGSSLSLLRIIDDILDFSKIEANKLDVERVALDPVELVEGAMSILAPAAASKGLRLVGWCDPRLPPRLLGDPVRLRQILLNLGGNAIKFTASGRVVIRAERAGEDPNGTVRLRLSIADTGIGIPKEARDRLFKPFSQAETSTTRQFGGTGLGLSICHRLVELMKGEIGVESEPGRGARFWFAVPLGVSRGEPLQAEPEVQLDDLGCLLLSDDADEAPMLRSYLERRVGAVRHERGFAGIADPSSWVVATRVLIADAAQVGSAWLERLPNAVGVVLLVDAGATVPEGIVRLERPVRRADLIEAVALAAGRLSPPVSAAEPEAAQPVDLAPSREQALAQGRLLLVAEDHETNRMVLGAQLKRLGYAADFAANGKEALRMTETTRYAALLTDCHMPEMDGFELTRRLREAEEAADGRLPIVAVTANALRGEAERCLAQGMDDFLGKPVVLRELKRVLGKWVPAATQPAAFDRNALMDLVGGDANLAAHVLAKFTVAAADMVDRVADAATRRDGKATVHAAHGLKGSARTVCAPRLADCAAAIEAAATDEKWSCIDRRLDDLRRDLAATLAAIQDAPTSVAA